jgi:hypothetical protein
MRQVLANHARDRAALKRAAGCSANGDDLGSRARARARGGRGGAPRGARHLSALDARQGQIAEMWLLRRADDEQIVTLLGVAPGRWSSTEHGEARAVARAGIAEAEGWQPVAGPPGTIPAPAIPWTLPATNACALLHGCVAVAPGPPLLEVACGDDPAFVGEVLASSTPTRSRRAVAPACRASPSLFIAPGTRLRTSHRAREIGRGGMGVVYGPTTPTSAPWRSRSCCRTCSR